MQVQDAGAAFPKPGSRGSAAGRSPWAEPSGGHDWQIIVVYRGLHCPICKRYLKQLEGLQEQFHAAGVDVVAVSG
jgi:AhpC/TSA family.